MQAVRYDAYGATPSLVDIPPPECPTDGVLVEVRATGVCRSDWHAWQGHDPVPLPQVPGHEFAGVITAVGPQVTTRQVGERVTVPFVCGCGRCEYCAAGDAQVCPEQSQPGFTMPGSFAELVAIPAADLNVVPLPDDLDFVTAAALGCRFATAYRALTAHGRVRRGDWVAVHGCGGVGLSAVMIAVALGARVVAVDMSEPALDARGRTGCGGARRRRARRRTPRGRRHRRRCPRVPRRRRVHRHGRRLRVVRCVRAADTSRWDCCSASTPLPRCRWAWWSPRSSRSTAPTACPPATTRRCSTSSRPAPLRPDRLVGAVIGLADAGEALAAMSRPATTAGVTVVRLDPEG